VESMEVIGGDKSDVGEVVSVMGHDKNMNVGIYR
jgi:hypothetical protein